MSHVCNDCKLELNPPTIIFYCPTCDTILCHKCSSTHIRHNKKPITESISIPTAIPDKNITELPPIDIIVHIRNYQRYAGCRDTIKIANDYYQKFQKYITENEKEKLTEALMLMMHTNEFRNTSIIPSRFSTPIDIACDNLVESIKKKAGI